MSLDAMKQALEALEAGDWYIGQLELLVYTADDTDTHRDRAKVQAAIKALRAAIEQEQEPVAVPVAFITNGGKGELWWSRSVDENGNTNMGDIPLYTAPRQWQGLTDEDREDILRWIEWKEVGSQPVAPQKLIAYVERKLREKNHG